MYKYSQSIEFQTKMNLHFQAVRHDAGLLVTSLDVVDYVV